MEILRLRETSIEDAARKAAHVLKKGGLVLFPTDTLYGIAADATNPKAVALLRTLKGREKKKPISVIVPDVASIERYAVTNDASRVLAERFLPGALTLVLRAKNTIPEELLLNGAIGIRIPDDPFCLALARTFGKPYTATSANKSGRETPASVREVLMQFGHEVNDIALAIDDGDRYGKKPSTVVTTVDGVPYVLREGAIPSGEILS
ncbi:MAG: L-threonylcarbamoyladenylate synthase [Patescibacteria group bacterium]